MPAVAGVVLAAGGSSRLGRPKQLLDLGGEPVLRVTIRNALASKLRPVVVVLGYEWERVAASIGDLGHETVVNADYGEGQSTSVWAGLGALPPECDAVVFLLGDQPEVGAPIIDRVVAAYLATGAPIVQATYGGVPANPVLFDRSLFTELQSVTGDEGGRGVVRRHAADAHRVSVSDGRPPADIDTEADYRALVARWRKLRDHPVEAEAFE